MITAKDLRIGNYILMKIAGEWQNHCVTWKNIKWCHKLPAEFNKDYKPIPITPELLEKIGNKYDKEEDELGIDDWDDFEDIFFVGDYIGLKEGQYYIIHIGANYCEETSIYEISNPLKVFHHLQNIIYDLCDIELTL